MGSKEVSPAMLKRNLKQHFGLESFRPFQEDAIRTILNGKNVWVNLATSGGKSLIYQLAALSLDGVTVVVSPLIELMRDQDSRLRERGVPTASYHSGLEHSEKMQILKDVAAGKLKLFYCSPEALQTQTVTQALSRCKVSFIAVDEAHCVSQWGHHFRPSYLKIPSARQKLGNPPLGGFTATAPVTVRDDCLALLQIEDAEQFVGEVDRPNLTLAVETFYSEIQKEEDLFKKLRAHQKAGDSVLVYCGRIATAERLASAALGNMLNAAAYHGQMLDAERKAVAGRFMTDETRVLFCTNAFGMGIDKPNVRAVYHFEIPTSLEAYWQEAGRAGRDGQPSICTLLVHRYDARTVHRWLDSENPSLDVIRRQFELLCRGFKDVDPKSLPVARPFFLGRFLEGLDDCQWFRGKVIAALAALHEAGLISIGGKGLMLHVDPASVAGDAFPITQDMLNLKRAQGQQRCEVMLWYASQKKNHRNIILDHFRHNSVIDKVDYSLFQEYYSIDQHILEIFLRALDAREYEERDFARHLSATAVRMQSKRAHAGLLDDMTAREVSWEIANVASAGYIRRFSCGTATYLTLTEQGQKFLRDKGIAPVPPTSEDELMKHLHHPDTKAALTLAIRDWYSSESLGLRSENQWWELVDRFLVRSFRVCGIEVSGRRLAMGFTRGKTVGGVKKRDARSLLEFLFPTAFRL